MTDTMVGAQAPISTERITNGYSKSTTVRTTYNPATGWVRLEYILTIERKVMTKLKEEKDVLTPAPEWVQDELPLSFS